MISVSIVNSRERIKKYYTAIAYYPNEGEPNYKHIQTFIFNNNKNSKPELISSFVLRYYFSASLILEQ